MPTTRHKSGLTLVEILVVLSIVVTLTLLSWRGFSALEDQSEERRQRQAFDLLEEALEADHYISRDLKAGLAKWYKMSPKQIALAFKLVKDVAEREAREAAKAAKVASGELAPCPEKEKRFTVTGRLISTRVEEGYYGVNTKMLVEDDRGFRVWGTIMSMPLCVKRMV